MRQRERSRQFICNYARRPAPPRPGTFLHRRHVQPPGQVDPPFRVADRCALRALSDRAPQRRTRHVPHHARGARRGHDGEAAAARAREQRADRGCRPRGVLEADRLGRRCPCREDVACDRVRRRLRAVRRISGLCAAHSAGAGPLLSGGVGGIGAFSRESRYG